MLLAFVAVIIIGVVMHEALDHIGYSSANVTAGPDVRLGGAGEGRN
jgi:hypothetical protein